MVQTTNAGLARRLESTDAGDRCRGRVEMIEFMDIRGLDHSDKCLAPNLGLLSIKYPVEDIQQTLEVLKERGQGSIDINRVKLQPYGDISIFSLSSPDGAIIEFYEQN